MTNQPKISIAISTYECKGKGWLFLSELLNSIYKQKYKNYEVVVSDQSEDDDIRHLCKFYSNKMDIKLVDSRSIKRSISSNTNNAIKNCNGDYIKIMFMDDFFVDENALGKIIAKMEESKKEWLVCGTVHCYRSIHMMERPMIPKYNHQIHLGVNSISSPSVLTIKNKHYFDENLTMLMDCEMYRRLYGLYGDFALIEDYLVCNRGHEDQTQHSSQNLLGQEQNYCFHLYDGRIK